MNLPPADPAHALLTPALLELAEAVRQAAARVRESGQVRKGPRDVEAVHDFRVALRKLRTLLQPARRVYGKKRARAVNDDLRRFAQATGALRDEEVLRETLGALALPAPLKEELSAWTARRARQEQARRAHVRNLLRADAAASSEERSLEASLGQLTEILQAPVGRPRSAVELARRSLEEATHAVRLRASADPADVGAMHALRICWKRLRYTAELFAPILGAGAQEIAKAAARMQRRIGDLHDIDQAMVRIGRARGLPETTRAAVRDVLREARAVASERAQRDLVEAMAALDRSEAEPPALPVAEDG